MGLFSSPTLLPDASAYATAANLPPSSVQEAQKAKSYDFIICGGGTAGCVLASRLSEDPNTSVLVLEAGGNNNALEVKAPLVFTKNFRTERDWDYTTTPQTNLRGQEMQWPRGKLIGGSSSINAMMYHHCAPSDYDEWSEKFKCKGWSYKDLLPYLNRSEKYTPHASQPDVKAEERGSSGLWQTGHSSYKAEVTSKGFINACQEVGIPFNPDLNTHRGSEGCTQFTTFIDSKGQRSSAATAYLPLEVQKRSNLTIGINVMVNRIIFDRTGSRPKAIAVEMQNKKDGPKYYASANQRVVLCGGAINSPQTLMLSGVGPAAMLKKHNIPVIIDNALVGERLSDHLCHSGICARAKPAHTLDYLSSDIKALPSLARWLVTGGGPVSSNAGEAAAFVRCNDEKLPLVNSLTKPENRPEFYGSMGKGPDIELICTPLAYVEHGAVAAPAGTGCVGIVGLNVRPRSKGTISIKSADPWEKAVVDPKYFSDPGDNDRKVTLAGMRLAIAIVQANAMQPYLENYKSDDEEDFWWPMSATDPSKLTDDQLIKFMSKSAFTLYHPVGTVKMGPDAKDSVVDTNLQLHGADGLVVCDASIFPEQISGHPTAAVIAVAEKAAELLKGIAADKGASHNIASHL
ncbi:Glucose-methanol-choline oxidoreductase, C-terminal [Kalmanozyma brasiliensis GHG001]|uniref:Aryl-alcohol oxidase n=1 Tax=Kalmanozyma brasiliensis (strain GHG001) TaxID=1365824 RepID=V5EWQ5_KALBG|nr:Glucose-methanol-choline oxidoreductase, C-terminal [Kalmanozyma brasiliensis GHG001]EST07818.1 Glucose-methanol-choline oxidoreductase, C-terminal [Kalmanozyma brasiliensis GHG001]